MLITNTELAKNWASATGFGMRLGNSTLTVFSNKVNCPLNGTLPPCHSYKGLRAPVKAWKWATKKVGLHSLFQFRREFLQLLTRSSPRPGSWQFLKLDSSMAAGMVTLVSLLQSHDQHKCMLQHFFVNIANETQAQSKELLTYRRNLRPSGRCRTGRLAGRSRYHKARSWPLRSTVWNCCCHCRSMSRQIWTWPVLLRNRPHKASLTAQEVRGERQLHFFSPFSCSRDSWREAIENELILIAFQSYLVMKKTWGWVVACYNTFTTCSAN